MFCRGANQCGALDETGRLRRDSGAGVAPRLATFALWGALACGGDVLTLGVGDPSPTFGDSGRRVRNINSEGPDDLGATLTADLLEVFFVSYRAGGLDGADIWHATRRSRTDPFDAPMFLAEASSPLRDVSPAVSADGLTLWVGSDRELGLGGVDIWRLTRVARDAEWGPIENVVALNSSDDEVPRPPGLSGSVMPIASTRAGGGVYQTFLATRGGPDGDFGTIQPLDYLWTSDASMETPCLTDDGLLLFFMRAGRGRDGDLYLAWRTSTSEPFRDPIALSSINTVDDERDPFLSADQFRFFFSSNRRDQTHFDIYATSVDVPLHD
jgi:hypothetical protein